MKQVQAPIELAVRSRHYEEPIHYSSHLDEADWEKILAIDWSHDFLDLVRFLKRMERRRNAPLQWEEIRRVDPRSSRDGRLIRLRIIDAVNSRFRKNGTPYRLRPIKPVMRLKGRTYAIFKIVV